MLLFVELVRRGPVLVRNGLRDVRGVRGLDREHRLLRRFDSLFSRDDGGLRNLKLLLKLRNELGVPGGLRFRNLGGDV